MHAHRKENKKRLKKKILSKKTKDISNTKLRNERK